jgi:hypothetical protein
MLRGTKSFLLGLFTILFAGSLFFSGCTRYAKEEQMTILAESEAAAVSSEKKVEDLEKEKTDLEAKFSEKKQELSEVQAEEERLKAMAEKKSE